MAGLRSPKALPKGQLAQKKDHGHCLVVCCLSDPLQLSESQQNGYIFIKYAQQINEMQGELQGL